MATEDSGAAAPSMVDAGTPTPEEARLAAELENEGKPAPAPAEPPAAAAPAADGAPATDGADTAAAVAAEPAVPPATPPAPAAAPAPPPREPTAPRDFDAAYKENQQKFDDGEIDADAFQSGFRAIAKEEAVFNTQVTIFKERQQDAATRAAAEFNNAAVAWQTEHQAFMDNPLYAQAMQQAIDAVDKATPGLPAGELLQRAAKAAFEFTHYTPPQPVDRRAAIAAATAARKPGAVPATLGATPTGAHVDARTGSSFAELDAKGIDDLENTVARMSPAQVEAYLADAPGARATGQ